MSDVPNSSEAIARATARALEGNLAKVGDKLAQQGKLFVRERLDLVLDPGSFVEDALLANAAADDLPADGVVKLKRIALELLLRGQGQVCVQLPVRIAVIHEMQVGIVARDPADQFVKIPGPRAAKDLCLTQAFLKKPQSPSVPFVVF